MTLPTEHLFADTGENSSIALLKQHFPQCFDKDGLFLPDKLAEQLQTANVPVSREYYTMNWLGKSYARYLRDCPPITLLGEDSAHNTQSQNQHSQNLLIKGDNLEVLKHLKNAYANQVKMIYIDPPYNTGSDGFVYQDDRKFTPDELAKLADMSTDEARRVLDFTAKKSNSHSAWLTFMYPRLYIARELLKEDGVIFISIDDNEQAQLKLLCDEVFGEENFVAGFIINSNSSKNNSKHVSVSHEHMLCYAKTKSLIEDEWRVEKLQVKAYQAKAKQLLKMNLTEDEIHQELLNLVKYPRFYDFDHYTFVDKSGVYRTDNSGGVENGNFDTVILHPITNKPCAIPSGGWRYNDETLQEMVKDGNIVFGHDETIIPTVKRYLHDYTHQLPKSNLYFDSQSTTKWLKSIGIPFDFPKAIEFIKHILSFSNDKSALIMDFFAGSGTTAHAIMELNIKDGGNRQFICVQLPENLDEALKNASQERKKGIKNAIKFLDSINKEHNIFEITKERIIRSAQKIKSENPDYQGDLGFKIFETMPDFRATDDEISPQLEFPEMLHANLEPKQYETLLTTWCVYDGNALTQSVQSVELGGYSANLCGTTLYVVYPDFDSVAIKALLDKLDHDADFIIERIVLFGEMVESAKQRELKQALDTYNNKKNVHLSLLVRY